MGPQPSAEAKRGADCPNFLTIHFLDRLPDNLFGLQSSITLQNIISQTFLVIEDRLSKRP